MSDSIFYCVEGFEPKDVRLSKEELTGLLFVYSHMLGLHSWVIDLSIEPKSIMRGAMGRASWTLATNRASIMILDPEQQDADDDPMNMEHVLVHELLHVMFAAWTDRSEQIGIYSDPLVSAVCMEQPIERLAKLIVKLRLSSEYQMEREEENNEKPH